MSILLNGTSYGGDYVDCASDFWEVDGATLSVDAWGMDSLTRRFQGRLDKVATELAKYKRERDKRDTVHKWLYVTSVVMTESAPFAQLEVKYKGIYDGKAPAPVPKSGFRKQSVQLNLAGDTSDEVTATTTSLTYYAPYTTWRYVTNSRPTAAKYRSKIHLTAEALDVVSMTNSHVGELHYVNAGALSGARNRPLRITPVPGKFNAALELSTSQFDVEPAGKWFEVTETTELLLAPPSLSSQPQKRYSIA